MLFGIVLTRRESVRRLTVDLSYVKWRLVSSFTVAGRTAFTSQPSFAEDGFANSTPTEGKTVLDTCSLEKETGTTLSVSSTTDPLSFAAALSSRVRNDRSCTILASGDDAVMQFVQGAAVARRYLKQTGGSDMSFQANHCFWLDRNSCNSLVFVAKATEHATSDEGNGERIRVQAKTDMRQLALSVRTSLAKQSVVDVEGMGKHVISRMILALTWTRRLLLPHKKDIDCFPSIPISVQSIKRGPCLIRLTLLERQALEQDMERRASFALFPVSFSLSPDQLRLFNQAFSETADAQLPTVKVGSLTHPAKVASTMIRILKSYGGVQVLSSGTLANSQTLKSVAVCRGYVREVDGYDIGFQSIHAPRDNRNGECQLVSRVKLIRDVTHTVTSLKENSVKVHVLHSSDARMAGKTMAEQIEYNRLLNCHCIGPSAASRALVAVSYARQFLASKRLDLVALPYFEDFSTSTSSEKKNSVLLGANLLSYALRQSS